MAEDYSIELALLLALVREPDEIYPGKRYTWGRAPDQLSYDIKPPGALGVWEHGRGADDHHRKTTFHELFRWFSDPAYRKRYGLDK